MNSLKSKLIIPVMAIMMSPFLYQNLSAQEIKTQEKKDDWNAWIGTCGIIPNDSDLKNIFDSYIGIQAEAQKKLKDDIYLAVTGIAGFGSASAKDYTINARLTEMAALAIWKNGRFEIGAGPKLSKLKLLENDDGTKENYDYTGIGWEGRMQYKIYDGEKIDISAIGAYSKVKQDDPNDWPNLGTTRFGALIEF